MMADLQTVHVGSGAGETYWYRGAPHTIKVRGDQTNNGFSLMEIELPIGFEAPLHRHHREDETFWVLAGEISFFYDGITQKAGPGAVIMLPRGGVHGFRVEGPLAARAVALFTPGGFEGFFEELGETSRPEASSATVELPIERILAVSEKYTIDYVGPLPE